MLQFPPAWRFDPPPNARYLTHAIPPDAFGDVRQIIGTIATQGDRWRILEHFKGAFSRAAGSSHVRSTSESWAETDLERAMSSASDNAPLFLEALYDAFEVLKENEIHVPDVGWLNDFCLRHNIGYVFAPPALRLRDLGPESRIVSVTPRPPTIAESALETLQTSLQRSEHLLEEGRSREAVQESLWVLESVATAFRGLESATGSVGGKYFNQITKDLRRISESV